MIICCHALATTDMLLTILFASPLRRALGSYFVAAPFVRAVPVSAAEIQRLKKRFMKLDKDGSGSIDKDEFLQIPQIANNPLASRMIAIFDEE